MDTGKAVDPEVDDHPFLKVQLLKCPVRLPEMKQDIKGAEVFVKVDNEIKLFGFEPGEKFFKVFRIQPGSCKKRIFLQEGMILFLCQVMDLRIRKLCFQATDHRGG